MAALPVENPATLAQVGEASEWAHDMLDQAIARARRAFPAWAATPFNDRQVTLRSWRGAIEAAADRLAPLLTADQSKLIAEARRQVGRVVQWFRCAADLELPSIARVRGDGRVSTTRYLPLGVVTAIAPWNYSLLLAAFKVAAALLASNVVVLKPSPHTPLSTLALHDGVESQLPRNVCTVVTGGDRLG